MNKNKKIKYSLNEKQKNRKINEQEKNKFIEEK